MMYKQGRGGLAHILDAFVFSMQGLRAAWRNEIAFRLQSALLVPLIPLAVWTARSTVELVLLLGVCAVVLMAELFNSAIESIVDRISTELHPLSGQAKDLGSAGVFMSQMLFLIVWIPITWGRLSP
jgi:diacylglycerol kinase (ATP)